MPQPKDNPADGIAAVQRVVDRLKRVERRQSARTIRGLVNTAGAGSIVSGRDFAITRLGVGDIRITFKPAFSAVPAVIGMAAGTAGTASVAQSSAEAITAERCRLTLLTAAGAAADGLISFTAESV